MRMLIPITEEAAVIQMNVNLSNYSHPGYIYIVGKLTNEVVTIKRPAVEKPDVNNSEHWTAVTQNNADWELTAAHSTHLIEGGITIRIKKEVSPGNPFGVAYM